MSIYHKKLYIKKTNGQIQSANLYTDKNEVGNEYIIVKDGNNSLYVPISNDGDIDCKIKNRNGIKKIMATAKNVIKLLNTNIWDIVTWKMFYNPTRMEPTNHVKEGEYVILPNNYTHFRLSKDAKRDDQYVFFSREIKNNIHYIDISNFKGAHVTIKILDQNRNVLFNERVQSFVSYTYCWLVLRFYN